ncbi:hypothetical protein GGTG_10600 [Gaeumannomyces tritici R3-111a-1]|uniref:Extracellular membrane protein CFEM domain-containing protein n=1 Tax=Gaeumannomyces tritici (strain R3-111a-1) TaxID=644352 RepID=J3PAS5_GAET3|nr:hypothetical protein GGTG_10600 [Gaeumannomyces tritici R3-111a-1]EJT71341.1 hypothetical protein GGTG_10600 [Gaeumannomyces tritici R3-111a-1]
MQFSAGTLATALLSLLVAQVAATPSAGGAHEGALEARAACPSAPVFAAVVCDTQECTDGRQKIMDSYYQKLRECKKNKRGLLEARAACPPSAPGFDAAVCVSQECIDGRKKIMSDYSRKLLECKKNKRAAPAEE